MKIDFFIQQNKKMDIVGHFQTVYYFSLINAINIVIFELITLILKLFRIHRKEYVGSNYSTIMHNISKGFSTGRHDKYSCGIVMGKYYAGYVTFSNTDYGKIVNICILCTVKTWNDLSRDFKRETTINIYKYGSNFEVPKTNKKPWKTQKQIMDKIISYYEAHKHACVYIYGPPGYGKTQIGQLLAEQYNSTISSNLRIFSDDKGSPGYYMPVLVNNIKPEEESPLIIVSNEIDVMIKNQIKKSGGKREWNEMLDEYNIGFYNNTILIFTSNEPKAEIDKIDSSLLRSGRIDLIFEVTKNNVKLIT